MPERWQSDVRREDDGTVVSDQTVVLERPVVDETEEGARLLAQTYWDEVGRATLGLVRVVERGGALEQRLLGLVPLMRLRPQLGAATARFSIEGGLFAGAAGGSLLLAQERRDGEVRLHARVEGYRPRLPRPLYALQSRFHVRISRRWAARLA